MGEDRCPDCGAPARNLHEDSCWTMRAVQSAGAIAFPPDPDVLAQLIEHGKLAPMTTSTPSKQKR